LVDFIDRAVVHLKAGNGGNGCASIRREKFKPLAGPNGGNGGNGGSIILRTNSQIQSLLDFHFNSTRRADSGTQGLGGDKDGKRGDDLVLEVPVGTVVKSSEGETIVDMSGETAEFMLLKGGVGGLGNAALASSTRKAPGFALNGVKGEEADLIFELKLLADVALVGFPSAGKSSIVAAISAARPKIADYPFTTLTPNLGVVSSHGFTFTVADVPGLIPGASEGKGLGHEFLRHIQRTKVIVHVIDCLTYEPGRDPISDFDTIVEELARYDELHNDSGSPILERPKLVLLNKIDDRAASDLAELAAAEFRSRGVTTFSVSAATHAGLDVFVSELGRLVQEVKANEYVQTAQAADELEEITIKPLHRKRDGQTATFKITKKGGASSPYFEVESEKLRNWVLQTDFANDEAVGYLADRLAKVGVEEELTKLGAVEHDEVRILTTNSRAKYVKTEQEYYAFSFEPAFSAGSEILYSNIRGEDTRIDMNERVSRMTRKEKRDQFHQRQDARAATREEFEQDRKKGYWAEPDFDAEHAYQGVEEYEIDEDA
jgi:GTP-binding protein